MFRRRRGEPDDPAPDTTDPEGDEHAAAPAADPAPAPQVRSLSPRPTGPWDETEVDDDEAVARVDLGGLRVPVLDGVELRVDLDEQQQVVAASFVIGEDLMQLGVYAAPRSEGVWAEIAAEIAASLRVQGGAAEEVEGPFGIELRAQLPTVQNGVTAPARFVGIDGPRWFLRALHTGPYAGRGEEHPLLGQILRGVVVVRGKDAMAPRDPLPLRLPREAQEQAVDQLQALVGGDSADGGERDALAPPQRGPEITETR